MIEQKICIAINSCLKYDKECEFLNGIFFKIGSGFSDKERRNPPKVGDEVTFKYKEITKYGKPRFPVFLRISHRKLH